MNQNDKTTVNEGTSINRTVTQPSQRTVVSGTPAAAMADLQTQLAEALAANAALKAKAAAGHGAPSITLKVSEKGACSIYGLGRFPVTLYKSQMKRLFAAETVAKVNAFLDDPTNAFTEKA